MQPSIPLGALVGSFKIGSVARGVASTVATFRQISWERCIPFCFPLAAGAILGVSGVANLDRKYSLAIILFGIVASEVSTQIERRIAISTPNSRTATFWVSAFFVGAYAGFFGAGIGVMLTCLFRLKGTDDSQIVKAKIDARAVELITSIIAVAGHFYHGNLAASIWPAWALGSFIGGILGAQLLLHFGARSPVTQLRVLWGSYGLAVLSGVRILFSH